MVVSDDDVKAIDKRELSAKELGIIGEYPPAASVVWKDALRQ